MAGRTPRFKLNVFGSGTPGAIGDDGFKFTGLDRLTIDRLLAQVEDHDYRYSPSASSSLAAPLVEPSEETGALRGGTTYYYRFSVVDDRGVESMASEEASVATPAPLPAPAPVALSDGEEEGSLTSGMYYYAVTAIRGAEESVLGPVAVVSLQEGETSVLVEFPSLGDAESLRLWRMKSTEAGYTALGTFSGPSTVDTGAVAPNPCAGTAGNRPPQSNTAQFIYSLSVSLPETVDLSTARAWRLYRTIYPGSYPATSLVHEVVEREAEWDANSPLLTQWVDTGRALTAGQPMIGSDLNMHLKPFALHRVSSLPLPTGWPEGYPLLVGSTLYVKVAGEWEVVSGGGGGLGGSGVLTAPDGGRWVLTVGNDGSVSTAATSLSGPPAPVQDLQEV